MIEADGQYTKPYSTFYLRIGSGQRYGVLFKTKSLAEVQKDQSSGRSAYYLQLETRERPTLTKGYALLAYPDQGVVRNTTASITATIPDPDPLTLPNTTLGFLDYQLQPLKSNDFPSLSEVTRRVTITVQQIVNGTITWAENGLPWFELFPKTPYLVSFYEDLYAPASNSLTPHPTPTPLQTAAWITSPALSSQKSARSSKSSFRTPAPRTVGSTSILSMRTGCTFGILVPGTGVMMSRLTRRSWQARSR